jgi:hypothetical protein
MLQMALLDLLALAALVRLVRLLRPAAVEAPAAERDVLVTLAAYLISTSLLGVFVLQRMDLALGAAFCWFLVWQIERGALAGVPLAIGTWIKLTPALLLPLALVHRARRAATGRRAAWVRQGVAASWPTLAVYLCCLVALTLPFAWISGTDLARFLSPLSARGLQVESSYASLLLVLHHVWPAPLALAHRFGAWQIDRSPAMFLAPASSWITAATQVLVLIWYWRASSRTAAPHEQDRLFARACMVALLALLLTSKVFSPQFLLWVAPLLALLAGPLRAQAGRLVPAVLAAFLLTAVYTRLLYAKLLALRLVPALVLVSRNALLVALTVALVRCRPDVRPSGTAKQPAAPP